ncbi:hypothetical protein Tco_1356129, partial [Tanacetum coccineum]
FDYDCEVYDLSTKPLLGDKEFFVNKKQEEDLDKIKRVIKQESVKELVDGDNGLVDDKLMASNCDPQGFSKGMNEGKRVTAETIDLLNSESMESTKDRQVGVDNLRRYEVGLLKVKDALLLGLHECFNCSDRCSFSQGYVYKGYTNGEFILTTKLVFDPGGKRVCDLGGSRGRNVSGKKDIETNCKSRILVVVTSYVWVEKSLLGSTAYEFGGVGELVAADIRKQGMGGNELVFPPC